MKNLQLLDLYSDYLLSSFTLTTAVGLSALLDRGYSHDQISRFLAQKKLLPKDFWKSVKALIRKIENENGVLVVDDTIEEKPYTTENAIVCWHWDHSKERNIKGINIINFLYSSENENGVEVNLPLSYEIIEKTEQYYDTKSQKVKRRSAVTKNELVRERLRTIVQLNRVKFKYITWDSWFSSSENIEYVHHTLGKKFVAAIKSNRTIALSEKEKHQGKFRRVDGLELETNRIYNVWLKGVDFEVHLIKKVFINEDGSCGVSYLITNDIELSFDQIRTIYKKRWNVEEFHKSLKQNASLEKSPTKYEVTQSNHIFASMIAYCKLEILKFKELMNHFQLKSRLYICAIKAAFKELQNMKNAESKVIPIEKTAILCLA